MHSTVMRKVLPPPAGALASERMSLAHRDGETVLDAMSREAGIEPKELWRMDAREWFARVQAARVA